MMGGRGVSVWGSTTAVLAERAERASRRRTSVSTLGILIEALIAGGPVLMSALGLALGVAAAAVIWGLGGALAAGSVACLMLGVTAERARGVEQETDAPPGSR